MPLSQDKFFSIRRPLSTESLSDIQDAAEQMHSDVMLEKDHSELGLTIVEKTFISRYLHHRQLRNYHSRHRHVFEPVIPSSLEEVELKVKSAQYLGRNLGRLSLAYILDDPEDILQNEHQTYSNRIHQQREIGMHGFTPHISIGTVPQEHATDAVLAAATLHMPATITLRPVTSDHFYYLPRVMKEANSRYETSSTTTYAKTSRHRSEALDVRSSYSPKQALAHPISFLRSLQKEQ